MNIRKITYLALIGLVLLSCTPRIEDVFDDTSITRLENRRAEIKNLLISETNGWVLEYFPQAGPASPDSLKHRGYTFIMQFRDDGTVTVGAPMDGIFKTETSLWDVVNDNSTVLTFNSYNKIFHFYSSPDPYYEKYQADGEGIGGDYEFMVLQYNEAERYQLLKGKKWGCYARMYRLSPEAKWENYFMAIDQMKNFIFAEDIPLDLYSGDVHLDLYNGKYQEFRIFNHGADTLGGGTYFGHLITPNGLRINGGEFELRTRDIKINEHGDTVAIGEWRDTTVSIPTDMMILNASRTRLVSVNNPNIYITMDPTTAFESSVAHGALWMADTTSLGSPIVAAINKQNDYLHKGVGKAKGNKKANVLNIGFSMMNKQVCLNILYTSNGTNSLTDVYYFKPEKTENGYTITYTGEYGQHNLINYNGEELVKVFNGTYNFDILQPFNPAKGMKMLKEGDANFSMTISH